MRALIGSELKQRIRGKRWWIMLGLWFLVLAGLLAITRSGIQSSLRYQMFAEGARDYDIGSSMFGSLALFVLALACLVVPSLTSTGINGERDRGTLAILQATLYRPVDIFLAKLAAAMIVSGAFLAATLPLTAWCFLEGGVDAGRVVIVYLALLVACAVLAAIGLAASSLVRRPALSAVLSYGMVFLLSAGLPIVFGLSLLSAPREQVRHPEFGFVTEEIVVGWRWVLLAPDPFVVLADAAPRAGDPDVPDPLGALRDGVRASRRPLGARSFDDLRDREPPALWPAGVAIQAGLGCAAAYVTMRRLHVPARRLARGQRIA